MSEGIRMCFALDYAELTEAIAFLILFDCSDRQKKNLQRGVFPGRKPENRRFPLCLNILGVLWTADSHFVRL